MPTESISNDWNRLTLKNIKMHKKIVNKNPVYSKKKQGKKAGTFLDFLPWNKLIFLRWKSTNGRLQLFVLSSNASGFPPDLFCWSFLSVLLCISVPVYFLLDLLFLTYCWKFVASSVINLSPNVIQSNNVNASTVSKFTWICIFKDVKHSIKNSQRVCAAFFNFSIAEMKPQQQQHIRMCILHITCAGNMRSDQKNLGTVKYCFLRCGWVC